MKRLESHLPLVVSFALAGILTASLATGTAQSAVASLVQIVNTAANPVLTKATDLPALQPLYLGGSVSVAPGATSGYTNEFTQVPVGKQLVIDYVSAQGTVTDPEHIFSIELTTENIGVSLYVPVSVLGSLAATPSVHAVIASQAVVMYVSSGDFLDLGVHTDGGPSGALVLIEIWGHFVDRPS